MTLLLMVKKKRVNSERQVFVGLSHQERENTTPASEDGSLVAAQTLTGCQEEKKRKSKADYSLEKSWCLTRCLTKKLPFLYFNVWAAGVKTGGLDFAVKIGFWRLITEILPL